MRTLLNNDVLKLLLGIAKHALDIKLPPVIAGGNVLDIWVAKEKFGSPSPGV